MPDAHTLRHRLVAEIGDRGQAQIAAAIAHAPDPIAARYLASAGFSAIVAPSEAVAEVVREVAPAARVSVDRAIEPSRVETSIEVDPSVAPLLHGALAALRTIREASEVR